MVEGTSMAHATCTLNSDAWRKFEQVAQRPPRCAKRSSSDSAAEPAAQSGEACSPSSSAALSDNPTSLRRTSSNQHSPLHSFSRGRSPDHTRDEIRRVVVREEVVEHSSDRQEENNLHKEPWLVGKQYPVIEDILYFMGLRDIQKLQSILDAQRMKGAEPDRRFFCVDELLAEGAAEDLGPFSLSQYYAFAAVIKEQSAMWADDGKKIVIYSAPDLQARTRAACLLAAWLVLDCGCTPEDAWEPFSRIGGCGTFSSYTASEGGTLGALSAFSLQPIDILRGLCRAKEAGILPSADAEPSADGDECSELVSVVVPGALAVMQAPCDYECIFRDQLTRGQSAGAGAPPERFCDALRTAGAAHVLQLGGEAYRTEAFEREGIEHVLAAPWGSGASPSNEALEAFFRTYRERAGLVAVHCEGGLRKAAVLVCIFLMRKHRFTHREAIGYLRAVRPGAAPAEEAWVFLEANEETLWGFGDPDRESVGSLSLEGMLRRQMSGGAALQSILKHSRPAQRAHESDEARRKFEHVAEMIEKLRVDKRRNKWREENQPDADASPRKSSQSAVWGTVSNVMRLGNHSPPALSRLGNHSPPAFSRLGSVPVAGSQASRVAGQFKKSLRSMAAVIAPRRNSACWDH